MIKYTIEEIESEAISIPLSTFNKVRNILESLSEYVELVESPDDRLIDELELLTQSQCEFIGHIYSDEIDNFYNPNGIEYCVICRTILPQI